MHNVIGEQNPYGRPIPYGFYGAAMMADGNGPKAGKVLKLSRALQRLFQLLPLVNQCSTLA